MFLKSLTLRGFKSFADKTVLEFEPGVTVVVGPNGSGRLLLVDAVFAWVLGAQGRARCGGRKMDDVTSSPALPNQTCAQASRLQVHRSEFNDNSGGLLPIEFSEVTSTLHTLFAPAIPSISSMARRAVCSTSKSCCPTPASVVSNM